MAEDAVAQRGRLLERLAALQETLDERLELLGRVTGLPRSPRPIELGIPPALLDFVATVMAELDTSHPRGAPGHAAAGGTAETLALLYGESMPFALATQLAGLDARCPWLMATPLSMVEMPRLSTALVRLRDALDRVAPTRSPAAWERWLTTPMSLGELYPTTYFGGLQPLFGTTPEVLAELAASPETERSAAVDRLLGSAIFHEFMHFSRDRAPLWPPYLDEAIAGGLQMVLDPGCALPGDGEALEGFLTYAQVGLVLIDPQDVPGRTTRGRTGGFDTTLAAQAGAIDWDDVLPDLRRRALDLYWPTFLAAPAAHLHPNPDAPRRFADLFESASAPTTASIWARASLALRGASMRRSRPGRVVFAEPPPMTFDFAEGIAVAHPPHPGAPAAHLLHRLGGPRVELRAGADETDLRAALDATGLFDPS